MNLLLLLVFTIPIIKIPYCNQLCHLLIGSAIGGGITSSVAYRHRDIFEELVTKFLREWNAIWNKGKQNVEKTGKKVLNATIRTEKETKQLVDKTLIKSNAYLNNSFATTTKVPMN
eukprot:NODE_391_length_8148_cov_0.393838.p8 type:complete len:116 gc:universal NODE_391_length_8148_cov_0.393838:829-482(-)